MAQVAASRVVALTPEQAFAIASDVGSYPKFIPGVKAARLGPVRQDGDVKAFDATLDVAAGPLGAISFASAVESNPVARYVKATSKEGPMKHLTCLWTFKTIDGSRCQASVAIDYEFKSFFMQLAASAVMDRAVARVMDAFEARGRALYPMSAIPNI